MNRTSEPPLIGADSPDVVSVDAETEVQDWQEASGVARIWVWVVPIVVVHLALIYPLARSAFDFELPGYLHADKVAAWLWVNGAAIGLGVWLWKKGRVPVAAGKWIRGRRARWFILIWLGTSLAWFLLPAMLSDAWEMLSTRLPSW